MPNPTVLSTPFAELNDLAEVIWDWRICCNCEAEKICNNDQCNPWRFKRLTPFFQEYERLVEQYQSERSSKLSTVPLSSSKELIELVRMIKAQRHKPRNEVVSMLQVVSDPAQQSSARTAEQARAVKLAARVLLMINCSASNEGMGDIEGGWIQGGWKNTQSLNQFVQPSIFAEGDITTVREPDDRLNAYNLQRKAHLTLVPTNNMRRHLYLDRRNWTVEIFHHVSFLKECILSSGASGKAQPSDFLPRQLLLEVLDSVQKVLFPLEDEKSHNILQCLVKNGAFDQECVSFDSTAIGRDTEEVYIDFQYLGRRITILTDEIRDPRPYNLLHRWLQGISGQRYIMLATLIGVLTAVLLGVLALIMSAVQTYIAWKAWKYPVAPLVAGSTKAA